MPATFPALRVHKDADGLHARLDTLTLDDLPPGEVLIRAAWSDANYKDALAVTGTGRIMRSFPMTAGIDVSGVVEASEHADFAVGDRVLVVGAGLSETHDGGYAGYVRVPADWVVRVPDSLGLREAMAIGTAGFTAALAVERMEANGQTPEAGPIAVTGATGGVGSLAIDLLAGAGYEVHAITGKHSQEAYLRALGAVEVALRQDLDLGTRPLEKGRWGGAVDNLGGDVLAWLTRTTRPFGNIASIGLAASHELNTTVMPFILRGVSLLGINSVLVAPDLRRRVWARLGDDLRPRHLDRIVTDEVPLEDARAVFPAMIAGEVTGRRLIRISGEA